MITIYSSHGTIVVDHESGEVLEIRRSDPTDPETLPDISRVNLEEHFAFWQKNGEDPGDRNSCTSLDILDVGYWVGSEYEPPEMSWRQELLSRLRNGCT